MLRSQDFGDHAPPVREGPRVRPNREMDGLPIPRRYWAIAAISFGTSLFVVDGAIANVALPTIGRELGVGNGPVTNVVTVYQLMLVMVLCRSPASAIASATARCTRSAKCCFSSPRRWCCSSPTFRCCWWRAPGRRSARGWR